MQTLSLNEFTGDWRTVAQQIERSGRPVALTIDGTVVGIMLPAEEARGVINRYADRTQARVEEAQAVATMDIDAEANLPTYLEMLRDDPSLVPVVDGTPLRFETMMNSSTIDPEQLYQFHNPRTSDVVVYRASELRDLIGRQFANVEFIPDNPRAFVEGRHQA